MEREGPGLGFGIRSQHRGKYFTHILINLFAKIELTGDFIHVFATEMLGFRIPGLMRCLLKFVYDNQGRLK